MCAATPPPARGHGAPACQPQRASSFAFTRTDLTHTDFTHTYRAAFAPQALNEKRMERLALMKTLGRSPPKKGFGKRASSNKKK